MTSNPDQKKKCRECDTSLNAGATRCFQCGSHQNWHRFIPFGNSTLALIISIMALTTVFLPDPKAPFKEFKDYVTGTNFAMDAALVDININFASVLLENKQNSPAAMNSVGCLLNLPLDPASRVRDYLSARQNGPTNEADRPLFAGETMGVFQMTYTLDQPVLVRPYEAVVITFPVEHISPPLRSTRIPDHGQEVTNLCIVSGTNLEDEFAVGGVIVTPMQLNKMDLLEIIERADYGRKREHEREVDMSIVHQTRASDEIETSQ